MTGIYLITNKVNGKHYVGQSNDIKRRWMEHKAPHGTDTTIKRAMRKYGRENFVIDVLEECDIKSLDEREIFWIEKIKPEYNRTSGGHGAANHVITDEVKSVLSQKNKEYWKNLPQEKKDAILKNLTGQPVGHKVSEETREKLRKANLGKKWKPGVREKLQETWKNKMDSGFVRDCSFNNKKVVCVETGVVYNSIKEAGKALGLASGSCISGQLRGKYRSVKGFHFKHVV